MSKIPEKCLTCKFMEFADDELNEMRCFEPKNSSGYDNGSPISEDDYCDLYQLNKMVKKDAEMGMW